MAVKEYVDKSSFWISTVTKTIFLNLTRSIWKKTKSSFWGYLSSWCWWFPVQWDPSGCGKPCCSRPQVRKRYPFASSTWDKARWSSCVSAAGTSGGCGNSLALICAPFSCSMKLSKIILFLSFLYGRVNRVSKTWILIFMLHWPRKLSWIYRPCRPCWPFFLNSLPILFSLFSCHLIYYSWSLFPFP